MCLRYITHSFYTLWFAISFSLPRIQWHDTRSAFLIGWFIETWREVTYWHARNLSLCRLGEPYSFCRLFHTYTSSGFWVKYWLAMHAQWTYSQHEATECFFLFTLKPWKAHRKIERKFKDIHKKTVGWILFDKQTFCQGFFFLRENSLRRVAFEVGSHA